MPGYDWLKSFLKRQKEIISPRVCQNICIKRARVSRETVANFFKNIEPVINEASPNNIVNYDETHIADSPKGAIQLFRRGSKKSNRIMNTLKFGISVMYAASASGKKLDPYVVYKAKRLQAAWVMGGSRTAFYNTSPSGWFDAKIFEDWFDKVALPYFNSSNEPGNKIIIGDNVPSHINPNVVRKAEANNIKFIFLPPNSTHILQPLDVAVFRTLKAEWRKSLTSWKLHEGRKLAVIPKWAVPDLLRRLQ